MKFVKYSDRESWRLNNSGSFKVGTLSEYRSSEANVARMSDHFEGIHELSIGEASGHIVDAEIPGLGRFENVSWDSCRSFAVERTVVNEYVFCGSLGAYDKKHHSTMRYGNGTDYPGNSDLTHFVEIDLPSFIRGIELWSRKCLLANSETEVRVYHERVQYSERNSHASVELAASLPHSMRTADARYRATFIKPQIFSEEKEIRIILEVRTNGRPPEKDASALYPKSFGLKRAITRSGVLSGEHSSD